MGLSAVIAVLHIAASLVWVAGGVATVLTGITRKARATADEQVAQLRSLTFLGIYFFFPAMIIAVGTGLAMVMTGPNGWQPFAVLGLIGVAATLAFNALSLHPTGRRAVAIAHDRGTIAALVELKRFSRLAKFDLALRISVVGVMMIKPEWQDYLALGGIAAILAIGAVVSFAE